MAEDDAYAAHWLKHAWPRLDALLANRRFAAGFDAYAQEFLSYGGLLESVYGDANHQLFPDLTWHLAGVVLRQLYNKVAAGEIVIPDGLREEYLEFYEVYKPELYGPRTR